MELSEYLRVLRKYWMSIAAITLLGLLSAALVSLLTVPTYTATTSIFVSVQSGSSAGELQQGSTYAENQVKSFAQVVTMPAVLDPVISKLGLDTTTEELAKHITATVPTGTAIIQVDVVGTDPEATATLANDIATQLIVVVGELSPAGTTGEQPVVAKVVAPAAVPTQWTSPRVLLNLALGALVGLFLGLAQAVLRSRFNTTISTTEDISAAVDHSVVGQIGIDKEAIAKPLILQGDPRSTRAEEYRRLRTNLQYLAIEGDSRVIVVTSSLPGEGKTTTAINLATTLANAGEKVLLIDADLRRPMLATYLNLEGTAGLTTAIIGRATLADLVQPVGEGKLDILTGGDIPPNPSELLGSTAMKRLITEASARYDTVILDSPPLLPVTDAAILATQADGALIVVGSGQVKALQLVTAVEAIEQVGATVLWLVMNKLRDERHSYRQQGYYTYRSATMENVQPVADATTIRPGSARRAAEEEGRTAS